MASKSVNTSPGRCRNSPHSSGRPGCAGVCTSCSTSGRRVQISVPRGRKSRPTCAGTAQNPKRPAGAHGSPRRTSASSTLDLPLLWQPTTATCGSSRSPVEIPAWRGATAVSLLRQLQLAGASAQPRRAFTLLPPRARPTRRALRARSVTRLAEDVLQLVHQGHEARA